MLLHVGMDIIFLEQKCTLYLNIPFNSTIGELAREDISQPGLESKLIAGLYKHSYICSKKTQSLPRISRSNTSENITRKLQTITFIEHRFKNPEQIISTSNSAKHKNDNNQVEFVPVM